MILKFISACYYINFLIIDLLKNKKGTTVSPGRRRRKRVFIFYFSTSLLFIFPDLLFSIDNHFIEQIQYKSRRIDFQLNNYKVIKMGYMGETDEKGNSILGPYHLAGFYNKNLLMKIENNSYETDEEITAYYYFWDEKLIYIETNKSFLKKRNKFKNQFYFHNDKMILWILNYKKLPDNSIEFKEKEAYLLKEIMNLTELLKNLKKKKNL